MKTNPHITTEELDDIARLGLDDLRACFQAAPPDGSQDRAEMALRILRQGTSRLAAENNRIATALQIAKASGATPADVRVLWQQVINKGSAESEKKAIASADAT